MVNELSVMIAAVIAATLVMIVSAKTISDFVDSHPTLKILALSFLLMIGFTLIAEAFDSHIPKGYIYFAMAFSIFVEILNIKMRKKPPEDHVKLRERITPEK
ncbi:Integral membrane protein TerC family protein [compost metagenome]